MKSTGFLIVLLILLSPALRASQTAKATLFCWSLRFQQGQGPTDETLDLSTISGTPNGELAPWYSLYTHRSGFALDYSGFPITGNLFVDLPIGHDANDNGFDDNFEVSQGINDTSDGEYITALGGGAIYASWNRAPGSKDGSCSMHLVDDTFGDLGTYQFSFEVLEYTGDVSYTPGIANISANANLTNATDQLQGPAIFEKSISDPYNELLLDSISWTNNMTEAVTSGGAPIYRDEIWPTNYYGKIIFDDGDLTTSSPDYRTWELSIDDLNDYDSDEIPDFSDDPAPLPPAQPPQLSLTLTTTNLLLTIVGDVGRLHHILESTNLTEGNWVTNLSITLTNSPQEIELPLPDVSEKYWRAIVP